VSGCGNAVLMFPKKFRTYLYLWLICRSWFGWIRGLKIIKHRCIIRNGNLFLEGEGFVGRCEGNDSNLYRWLLDLTPLKSHYADNAVEVSYWDGSDHHRILYRG